MTITLNRRLIFGLLVAVITITGLVWAVPQLIQPAAAPEASPEAVAANFALAYYVADYRDSEKWLAALEPHMTEKGLRLIEAQVAPVVWESISAAKFSNTPEQVSIVDKGLVAEGKSNLPQPMAWQIQRVQVTLAPEARWPGMSANTITLNVLLERPADGDSWKVSATLTDQSVTLFKQENGQ